VVVVIVVKLLLLSFVRWLRCNICFFFFFGPPEGPPKCIFRWGNAPWAPSINKKRRARRERAETHILYTTKGAAVKLLILGRLTSPSSSSSSSGVERNVGKKI
jgi:hypothetical protein